MLCVDIELDPISLPGILVSDVDIKAEHERSSEIGFGFVAGLTDRGFGHPLFTGERLGQWRCILPNWTQIIQPMPTHFDFSAQSFSRTDRIWAFGPSNLSSKMHIKPHDVSTPEEYYGQGLSDHAIVIFSFGRHVRTNSSNVSLPKFIFTHLEFKLHLNASAWYCNLLEIAFRRQRAADKTCFQEASKLVLLHM